jgi:hypothetical protein
MVVQVLVLYFQCIYGGSVIVPKICNQISIDFSEFDYYKSKEEIVVAEKDFEKVTFIVIFLIFSLNVSYACKAYFLMMKLAL